jgi:uncharacterized protein (DUF58 family)
LSPDAPFAFAPDFRNRLNQLAETLLRGGGSGGESGRQGRAPGNVEFKDHRPYVAGDDVRFLDWNVFLRSGALAVKTHSQDEAPQALVALDRSASMGPAGSRQDRLAREIAAAFGFLALRAGGEAVLRCSGGGSTRDTPALRGPRAVDAWLAAVEGAPAPAGADEPSDLDRLAAPSRPGRVVAWISDFLVEPLPAAAFAGLSRGASERYAFVTCAHEDALAPARAGDAVVLRDPERGGHVAAQHAPAWKAAFQDARAEHVAAVTALATRHRFVTVPASPESRFEECLQRALRPER